MCEIGARRQYMYSTPDRDSMGTGRSPGLCFDCLRLGLRSAANGRSTRCQTHQDEYRRWYRRKWKYETQNPGQVYPEADYRPTEAVRGALVTPEAIDTLWEVLQMLNSVVVTLVVEERALRRDHGRSILKGLQADVAQASSRLREMLDLMRLTTVPSPSGTRRQPDATEPGDASDAR